MYSKVNLRAHAVHYTLCAVVCFIPYEPNGFEAQQAFSLLLFYELELALMHLIQC